MDLGFIKPKNNNFLVSRYQTTAQIAGAIVKAIDESQATAQKLSKYFKNPDQAASSKLIFIFSKNLLPYKKESSNRQTARTLNRIIADSKSGGDCKHFATMAAALCKSLGIKCKLRLISQRANDPTPNHIYCVAEIKGKDFIIDPVLKSFDTEARYNSKFDIKIN